MVHKTFKWPGSHSILSTAESSAGKLISWMFSFMAPNESTGWPPHFVKNAVCKAFLYLRLFLAEKAIPRETGRVTFTTRERLLCALLGKRADSFTCASYKPFRTSSTTWKWSLNFSFGRYESWTIVQSRLKVDFPHVRTYVCMYVAK